MWLWISTLDPYGIFQTNTSTIHYTPKWPLIILVITFPANHLNSIRYHRPSPRRHWRKRTNVRNFLNYTPCFVRRSSERQQRRQKRNIILVSMINSNWIFGAALLRIKIPSQSITACYAHKVEIKIRFDAKSKWCRAASTLASHRHTHSHIIQRQGEQ